MTHTLPGSRREVMRLAWPIGVSMLSFTMKGFVDTLMVGQLGTDALGAVGFASVATWFVLCFPWGILRGQRPLVSQYLGAGDRSLAFSFGVHAFALALVSGLLLLMFAAPIASAFDFFASKTELSPAGQEIGTGYFRIRLMWLLPTLLTFAIAEYMRSVGNTRVPMAVDLLVHPLNIVLNYALIFGHWGLPQMGANGAALGTGLADVCGLLLILFLSKPKHKFNAENLRLSWSRMREVIKVGMTGGIQFSLENLSFLSITFIVGRTDTVALAVHNAGIQLVHLSLLPAVAIGDAGSVLIGKFVGEFDWDSVRRTVRSTLEIMIPFMMTMALIYLVFGRELAGIFLKDEDPVALEHALNLGKGVMAACALWQLGDAFQVAFRFALRAAGDHVWVMWTGILCTWLLSIPLALAVVYIFHGNVVHIWFTWAAEIFVGSGIFLWRWNSGAWMKKRLVQDGDPEETAETPEAPAV
jgi:multidrug resistance protein, MATE family